MQQKAFKILIVDDQRSNLDELCKILLSDNLNLDGTEHMPYKVGVAFSGPVALEMVMNDRPDIILLDIIMPGMSGFDVLRIIKNYEMTRSIPVIVITGLNSVEEEERAFRLGAVDYVTKPFHKSLVKARVMTHLRLLQQMRMIEQLALIDTLTGIPNRRGFDNRMSTEWVRAVREKETLSLLMIDADMFKILNDTYGHLQGDVALKTIADVIQTVIKRSTDYVARWGGEEFAVLLPNTDADGALTIAEDIRGYVEYATIPNVGENPLLSITVSVGVATIQPTMEHSMTDFIDYSDKALYIAKKSGRNRCERIYVT